MDRTSLERNSSITYTRCESRKSQVSRKAVLRYDIVYLWATKVRTLISSIVCWMFVVLHEGPWKESNLVHSNFNVTRSSGPWAYSNYTFTMAHFYSYRVDRWTAHRWDSEDHEKPNVNLACDYLKVWSTSQRTMSDAKLLVIMDLFKMLASMTQCVYNPKNTYHGMHHWKYMTPWDSHMLITYTQVGHLHNQTSLHTQMIRFLVNHVCLFLSVLYLYVALYRIVYI